MKEYKTFNQQMMILRGRGMTVPTDGRPKRFLEQENYYNVINGYKDLFLKRDANGRAIVPEEYLDGTHFNELKKLFL
ncbi:TPA: Abi family protein, partial [Streptococcus pyogenes]